MWKDGFSENMGIPDQSQTDMDEIIEKKILLDVLEEAMGLYYQMKDKWYQRYLDTAYGKDKVMEKLRAFFRDRGFDM